MADENHLTEKQLEILHDHYKETFARLQQLELVRDRLFQRLIGLFALLSVEIGYPSAIGGTMGKFNIAGGELNLQALPLPALLNASWVLTAVIALRYCQATISVNRQYPYLHKLEEVISPELGGGIVYQREGKAYLSEYPLLLDIAWFAYVILFPTIVISASILLVIWEVTELPYPMFNKILDIVLTFAIIFFFFGYRVQPAIASRWRKFSERNREKGSSSTTTP